MNKALLIGIDDYPFNKLNCCINDVNDLSSLLKRNEDGTNNFNIATLKDEDATKARIRGAIKNLFNGEEEIALLYFSGHGADTDRDGMIVAYDCEKNDIGISMTEILRYANQSKHRFKIIILDCCHSGYMGETGMIGDTSILNEGVVIITASRQQETAKEINGHGVFTNLLIEAIKGGSADILGNITPGNIYSYIDQALGPWGQRPLFKANISSFVRLRRCKPKIEEQELRKLVNLFEFEDSVFKLDPSFERTNIEGGKHANLAPYAIEENVETFTFLQRCNRNALVVPTNKTDMYFAAMESDSCKLTPLGKHYWNMIKGGLV